jgi:hypothetical protein
MNMRSCCGLLMTTSVLGCSGTETSNPTDPGQTTALAGFANSGCKKEAQSSQPTPYASGGIGAVRQALDTAALAS